MRIFVPGNLLLLGEYAVTLPGGLGIAMAVENAQVVIEAKKSSSLKIGSSFQGDLSLPKKILSGIQDLDVHIDSSSFYDTNGRKKGFGSSAAVCAGLCYLKLKHLNGREPDLALEVFPYALETHRAFQGGRGSGYDVSASLFGGCALFTGGQVPTQQATPFLPEFYLFRGEKAVASSGAVQKFEQFCRAEPSLAQKFLRLSNRMVRQYLANPDPRTFFRAASLNRWMHRQLGISQDLPPHSKALGAGDEIAAVLGDALPLEKMKISTRGLQCS